MKDKPCFIEAMNQHEKEIVEKIIKNIRHISKCTGDGNITTKIRNNKFLLSEITIFEHYTKINKKEN